MTKPKKQTKRRKGQSASKAMLRLVKDWKRVENINRGRGFTFNDELNTAIRLTRADTLRDCQEQLKAQLKV